MKFIFPTQSQLIYAVAAIAFLLSLGILGSVFISFDEQTGSSIISLPVIDVVVDDCPHRRVLDGMCVMSVVETNPDLITVMVENHFESWPKSGISAARVVYEAPVEGNISRFLLLFTADQEVAKVGPVRSARPYFLDWTAEYGTPPYMHVGGSPAALSLIISREMNDVNEFFRSWYFWRDSARYAPHNTYTSSELWTGALERYADNYTQREYDGWKFDDVDACDESCISNIEVVYSGRTYTASWQYNSTTESYFRDQAGNADIDTDGSQIVADTVIVQSVDTTVLDGVGRLGMDTIGTGSSTVFQKGHTIDGSWKKESISDRTRFYAISGDEIILQAGKVWVQVINRDDVEYN